MDRYEEWTSCEEYGHTYVDACGEPMTICIDCGEPKTQEKTQTEDPREEEPR